MQTRLPEAARRQVALGMPWHRAESGIEDLRPKECSRTIPREKILRVAVGHDSKFGGGLPEQHAHLAELAFATSRSEGELRVPQRKVQERSGERKGDEAIK